MIVRAPAKINLGLRVVGKRKDGYHLLDTVMVPVSLFDEIEITKKKMTEQTRARRRRIEVTCDDPRVPAGEKNLVYQAALLVMKEKGVNEAVRIRVRKRIPVGAGLGGGSSDAAATLVGLNRLFGLGYSFKKLRELALSLGADVPFFIRARPSRVRGIGERLHPLRRFPRLWCVIVYPGIPVSSAWVYRNWRGKLTKPCVNTSITLSLNGFVKLSTPLVNDLERVTVRRYPRVGILKDKLTRAGAAGVLMSGSGSSVFGLFNSRRSASRAFRRLRKEEEAEAFLVRVLN